MLSVIFYNEMSTIAVYRTNNAYKIASFLYKVKASAITTAFSSWKVAYVCTVHQL